MQGTPSNCVTGLFLLLLRMRGVAPVMQASGESREETQGELDFQFSLCVYGALVETALRAFDSGTERSPQI